uniref:SGNH hydrolase-type esterase domain-containing protein n=1 Tax=Seriola lalandi dorsalis TaxID=1841481 RepID=A0A3B4YB75_SERLL
KALMIPFSQYHNDISTSSPPLQSSSSRFSPSPDAAASPQQSSSSPVSVPNSQREDRGGTDSPSCHVNLQAASPCPLFSPCTLRVGDSMIRNIQFFNVVTHCFLGATLPVILDKLPGPLHSLRSSIKRVVVHVGTNDTVRQHSEQTKNDFNDILNFLSSCGKSVFISCPIPTLARGTGQFSRILSLHTWLHSACSAHNISFIDNFNLFWNCSSFFWTDGVHQNRLQQQPISFQPINISSPSRRTVTFI